jgi:hypothetical protein
MDKTDKQIISATAAIVAPLAVFAVVLKIKSRKLQTRMNLREDITNLLQKAKTAGTDEETEQLVAQALAAWDALDPKTFKNTFSK